MSEFPRITRNPKVMGGKPCIRGMRMTVGMIVGQMSGGATAEEMLDEFPLLEKEDIYEAMAYAAWLASNLEHETLPAA